MTNVAITGSTGMIGSHLKVLLINKKINFLDVNRSIWDLSKWKNDEELDKIFQNIKVIFHFAAFLPTTGLAENKSLFDVNVRNCLNLAQWATKRDVAIIYLSGSTVYENPNSSNILEDSNKVIFGLGGFYGYSKLLAENIFSHFIPQGLKITILRPTSVYGIGLGRDKLINIFLNQASNNDTIILPEPNNKINFIHAMDVAYVAFLAYEKSAYGIFNIAGNEMTSILNLAELSILIVKKGKIIKKENEYLQYERFNLNCDFVKDKLGFIPKVSIKMGIEAMNNDDYLVSIFS